MLAVLLVFFSFLFIILIIWLLFYSIEVHPKDVKEFSKESVVNSTLVKGENLSLKSGILNLVC